MSLDSLDRGEISARIQYKLLTSNHQEMGPHQISVICLLENKMLFALLFPIFTNALEVLLSWLARMLEVKGSQVEFKSWWTLRLFIFIFIPDGHHGTSGTEVTAWAAAGDPEQQG